MRCTGVGLAVRTGFKAAGAKGLSQQEQGKCWPSGVAPKLPQVVRAQGADATTAIDAAATMLPEEAQCSSAVGQALRALDADANRRAGGG
jgi:hypothetical protein